MALTKEAFSPTDATRIERIDVPELGDCCYLRVLSARDRDAYEVSMYDGETWKPDNLSARLLVLCLCDEDGVKLFDNAGEGAKVLGDMPGSLIKPLFQKCRDINGMGTEALEQAVKNSEGTTDSDSNTD